MPALMVAELLLLAPEGLAAGPVDRISILAPASAGGGFDLIAHAMRDTLLTSGLASEVIIENSPGAGGVVGLAQFVNGQRGEGSALLVGGRVMLSAIRANRATVSLAQSTPLARLSGEYEVIVVRPASEIRDVSHLLRVLRENPAERPVGAGSLGGADQLFLNELAVAVGLEPSRLNYVPLSGGGEVVEALESGQIAAGISGWGSLASDVQSGRLRALAISSERRLPGADIPTLHELGIDLTFVNWRGVFAPPGLDDEQRGRLRDLVEKMVRTDEWRSALARHRWTDLYLAGDGFVRFLLDEEERVARSPDPRGSRPGQRRWIAPATTAWLARNRVAVALLLVTGLTVVAGQRLTALRRERRLYRRLEEAEEQYRRRGAETQELLRGLSDHIERQFQAWGLTAAEREIALLMLKGLRHKEIASLRGTSYGTVRQQALMVYKKSGLDGRTDLAVFFLEKLLQPEDSTRRESA